MLRAAAPATATAPSPPSETAQAVSRPADPILLQLHWQPQAQFAGYIVASEKGFFREAGLKEVKLEWAAATESPLARLAAGETDFCTAWLSQAIRHRATGVRLVCLAQIIQKSAMMLVTRSDSGITHPKDMNGRRVGLWGGDFDVPPKAFFAKYGVRPEIVAQSTSMVPFLRGAVAIASAMQYNEYHKLMEAGLRPDELRVFAFADYGIDFPEDGVYCMEATRRGRRAVCEALVAAVVKGWAYAFAHEAETLDLVMNHCRQSHVDTNPNHQRWMLRSMRVLIQHRVGENPANWGNLAAEEYAKVSGILKDQGLVRRVPPFESFYQPVTPPRANP